MKKSEVNQFLKEFKTKKKIFQILFRDDRGKNLQTLAELEISPLQREQTLDTLVYQDYSEGPIPDNLYHIADLWVFGKTIKNKEV